MQKSKIVACFGDSLTKGNFSYNWVKLLSEDYEDQGLTFLNFGENGELAYNLLQRIGEVLVVKPDIVIVLVGSNDAMGSLDDKSRGFYTKQQKLPKVPSLNFYAEYLFSLAGQLKDKTDAKIVFVTLPPLGEVFNDKANRVVGMHNDEIRQVCESFDFDLLDLNKALVDYWIKNQDSSPYPFSNDRALVVKAAAKKYMFFRSWNQVSKGHEMILSHDGVHLNETSGGILASLVKNYLNSLNL